MMKLLMVNLPFSGHTNPTLELARQLVEAGHKVSYIHAEEWRHKILAAGADFIPYDPVTTKRKWLGSEVQAWNQAYQTIIRVGVDYDALIYEMLFLQGKQAADQLGIPAFRLFSTFALNEAVLSDFAHSGGWYMTKAFQFPWLCRFIGRRLQKKQMISRGDIVAELCHNQPKHNFVYTPRDFQLYSDQFAPERFDFVGASIPQETRQDDFTLPDIKGQLIYVSLGTLLNTSRVGRRFFKLCIETFANQNLTLILSIGQGQNIAQYGSLPDNIHIYDRVPQLEVLQKADLFITHGGMNSVNEAIYFGVPMIVLPIGNDQPTVAKQVQACGLGRELAIRSIDSAHLQEAVEDVLSNPSYADQARYYADLSVQAGGNQAIVAKIEALMSEWQA